MAKKVQEGGIFVGCAGWALPREHAAKFPIEGTHLSRYSGRIHAVEINSSFYRPHQPATYARWAASVPESFRFSVKVPKLVTHGLRLVGAQEMLDRFMKEATQLGDKLGPLLVQLPPSLAYQADVAKTFFSLLRERFDGEVALEPRHASWFEPAPEKLLVSHRVARVAADPALIAPAALPGGWGRLVYYRLHGSPKVYYSAYGGEYLEALSKRLREASRSASVWCIFDNTAEGSATFNALSTLDRLDQTCPSCERRP